MFLLVEILTFRIFNIKFLLVWKGLISLSPQHSYLA